MKVLFLRVTLLTIIFLPLAYRAAETVRADEKPKSVPGEKAGLVTRAYPVRASVFGLERDFTGRSGNPEISPKQLPRTVYGDERYDVMPFFEAAGVRKSPGTEAILIGDEQRAHVVVTGSPEMQESVQRVLGLFDDERMALQVELTANLWEYEDDQLAEAGPPLRNFAEIRKRAGDSLKLVYSQSVLTKSGQRCRSFNKEADDAAKPAAVPDAKPAEPAPQAKPAEPVPDAKVNEAAPEAKPAGAATADPDLRHELNGARGSVLEVEPTIGPDGETVDFQISYEARLRQAGGGRDAEIEVTTNATLVSNHDIILYRAIVRDEPAPARKGKARFRALVVRVHLKEVERLTPDEYQKHRARSVDLIIFKARSGLGAPNK